MAGIRYSPALVATLFVAGVAVLSACGGDDDAADLPTQTPSPTRTAPPTETVAGATTVPAETPTPAQTTYTVVAGDTLGAIAERFNTTIEAIAEANDIADPNAIDVGQVLVIPPPAE